MKHNLLDLAIILVVAAAFGGTIAAQEQNRSKVTWKLATVDEKKIVHCEKDGWDCATSFLTAARNQPDLARYAVQINSLLDELRAQNKDKNREPVFIATPYAPFLAWCRRRERTASAADGVTVPPTGNDRLSKGQAITRKDAPDAFYKALGISQSLARYKNTESRWYYQTPDGVYWCRISGDTQLVASLLRADTLTPSHDSVMADYTNRINAILDEATKHKQNPKHVLSLLVTPDGLLLAWSQDDNSTGPLPKGSVVSHY
jgi:hypothetical protein